MPIGFIDSLVHNSSSKGLVDSNFTRGGVRTSVANLYDLALLSNGETPTAIGQFKNHSTIIYVENTSPLIEVTAQEITDGLTAYITVGSVNLKAPTETAAGAFYYLEDLSKMVSPTQSVADITVTGNGSSTPYEGTVDAWKPLSDTITTNSGSDFSSVVTNYNYTTDESDPASFLGSVIVPDDATGPLTINVPTASEVHGVFDQGTQTGDGQVPSDDASPIAIRAINGDSYLKRIDFVDRAIIGTDGDPMGGLVVEGSATPNVLETVARFGGTDAADGAFRRVTVNAEFNAALSRTETITGTVAATSILMDNAVGLALSVPSFTTAELNTNVDEDNGDTPYTNKFSGLSISGLPATTSGNTALVLGPSSVLGAPSSSATKVFTRALGDMAFTNTDSFNIGVSTLQPHSNGNLLVVDDNATTATSGDLQVKLNSAVNIGEQNAVSGTLTVNQSGLDDDGNGLLDATFRVYGNATIDGDLSVLGTTTTIASSTVSFEDTMLEIGVAREADGSLSPNIANNNIPDDSGLGLEVFHGTNDAGGTNAYRRPRIEYVTSNSNHEYGFWRLNHGYVPTGENDDNGDPTYSGTQDGGRILSEGDVSLTPIVETANEFLYHDVADDDSENDLKFVTTPTGLLKQYSQTESFVYTPLGSVNQSTYDQVFDRSYARMSVVPVTYGIADTVVEPRPNGAIRILHGLENGDGLVYVIGIVTARASGSLLPPIGAVVHPKVSTRASDGTTGTADEYHKSCDVFVKGAIEDDAIKFIVFG